jgi:hypothetical protein
MFGRHSVPPLQDCCSLVATGWQLPPRQAIAKQSPPPVHVVSVSTGW